MKKILSAIVLVFFAAMSFAGCHTLKGAKQDVQDFPQDVANGATAAGHGIMKADAWIRDNMW